MAQERGWKLATAPKRITVQAGSEIARLLDEAAMAPLLLEKNGQLFRLDTVDKGRANIWADYDPNKALEGIRAAAGSWKDIDADAFKEGIHRSREEGTRPETRP